MRLTLSRPGRRGLVAIAAVALVASGLAVVTTLPAFAAASCQVAVSTSPWTESPGVGGYTANLTVTNTGDPITAWTLNVTLPSGQGFTQGWSANWTASGTALTATNMSWNGSLATGGSTQIGYNGRWSGSFVAPSVFKLNGTTCNGSTPPTTTTTTTNPPTTPPTTPPSTTTPPPTTPPTTTTPPCTTNCPAHVDNPFAGATGYVNPEWAAKANSEPGGNRISNQPTGVWLDRIAAIAGTTGSSSNGSMGLRDHLNAAVQQDAANGSTPLYAQFVIYDLPNRDCSALASNGELRISQNGLQRYKTEYIDPIASILADPTFKNIRIVLIIEIDSLPNLITNTNVADCAEAQSSGAYVQGVQYALSKFHAISNVYNYVDAAHHGWLGWDSNFGPAANLFTSTAQGATGGVATVDGFITNTANYSALTEPFFTINSTVNGTTVRQSKWVDWNFYIDELTYAQAFRNQLIADGFPSTIGMIIDTSRNGWGGSARPTATSTSTDLNTFVDQSRVDRRIHAGNWCNQSGAGLGERPRANPAPGIDAYVWIKPPGESDGSSTAIANTEGKGFDRMCDPTYTGNARNGNNMTGALPNAPISGAWFSAQFQQLMQNAFPAL
jgi:cellulose 1,4-beta-cellobiosidase